MALEAIARRKAEMHAVLLVGDIGPDAGGRGRAYDYQRHLAAIQATLSRFEPLGLELVWVPGNHDPDELPLPGNVDRVYRPVEIAGVRIAGIGGAGPARFGFPYEWSEEEIRRRAVPECDILISHAPPKDTPLDSVAYDRDKHVGSEAIRERAEAHEGLMLCGHIHESAGAVQLGRCLVANLGSLGQPYPQPRVAWVGRNESDGTFHVALEHLETGHMEEWRHT